MNNLTFLSLLQEWFQPLDLWLRWLSLHTHSHYYLLISATLYLSGFSVVGARLACGTMVNVLAFGSCRHFFPSSRPYWDYPQLFNGIHEKAWGMPSGHSQGALIFWGLGAWSTHRKSLWGVALLLATAVALSRMYLGLHYPLQVFVGLGIGLSILMLWITLESKLIGWLKATTPQMQVLSVLAITSLPLLITVLLREVLHIGSGNGSSLPYQHLSLYTGLMQSTGLCLLYAFQHTSITRHPFSVKLVICRTLPALIIAILLWQSRFGYLEWFEQPLLTYGLIWVHGAVLASWVILGWPLLLSQIRNSFF